MANDELVFPLRGVGADGQPATHRLSDATIRQWVKDYKGVDVRAECRKAIGWLTENPGQRPMASAIERWMRVWLLREVHRTQRTPA